MAAKNPDFIAAFASGLNAPEASSVIRFAVPKDGDIWHHYMKH